MSLTYTVRPISDRTWFRPAGSRQRSRFTAPWSDTLELLERELDHLDARRACSSNSQGSRSPGHSLPDSSW